MNVKQTEMKLPKKANNQNSESLLVQNADLILPWLTHQQLATLSLTSKSLHNLSQSITLNRISDASRNFENFPIPFLNNNNNQNHPYSYFLYTPSLLLSSTNNIPRYQPWGGNSATSTNPKTIGDNDNDDDGLVSFVDVVGCDCGEICGEECGCLGFCDDVGRECGPGCFCEVGCGNRVSRNGVAVRVKIVRCGGEKGWGLFADQVIRKGEFLFHYAGELLTTKEAQRRQQFYDELSSRGRFSSALLVVREHLPSGNACLRLNIDATRIGNVARFVNHSCDGGNLSTKLIRSSGALFPRLCFFALKDIQKDEELTFSYGEIRKRSNGLPCYCNSPSCLGTLPSEDT
ncbi:histone-lysine N-methyltransferase SUVR3 [Vicia villosa]|uniref:histone-lysine N-methyltransferase SUVR3 n=1 Tax=Vicia villosa TaxID=3911 RepID=UPI00273CC6BB|nr:histone-lysine N-methyltransferase SUVR3 [Vicia villosa]